MKRKYVHAGIAGFLSLGFALAVFATDFDIPPQALDSALLAFAEQANVQVTVSAQGVAGLKSAGLKGDLTAEDALKSLLKDTGLTYTAIGKRTYSVTQVTTPTSATTPQPSALRIAQANEAQSVEEQGAPSTRLAEVHPDIPEILVVGSKTLNMDIRRTRDDAQPYITFDRETIARSGAQSIDEFIKQKLTASSNPASASQSLASGSNQSTIDLRGLGANQTLILVDGRRATSTASLEQGGVLQADLNGIPLAAIERIEVLPATASGIYGGGATGGVVNVILRRDYSGVETQLTYGDSFKGGGGTRRADLATGFALEGGRTSATLAASYSDGTDLLWKDRAFFQRRARELTLANNPGALQTPGFLPALGATTNITSADGSPLSLKSKFGDGALGNPITSVPYGYAGPASDDGAGLIANAGHYNLDLPLTAQSPGGGNQALVSTATVKTLSGSVRRQFLPWLDAFVDLGVSENAGSSVTSNVGGFFFLPTSAVANPFDQDILITTPAFGTDQVSSNVNRNYRAVTGLLFNLPGEWRSELDYTWSRTRTQTRFGNAQLTPDADAAVAAGTNGGAPFDVFRDTNETPVDFSSFLTADYMQTPRRLTFNDISLRFAGPLPWGLPAGVPSVTMLFEHRKEALARFDTVTPFFFQKLYSRSQTIDSIYLETILPLVASSHEGGPNRLELQLSARRDAYDITGANGSIFVPDVQPESPVVRVTQKLSSIDPTVSLKFAPIDAVTFRASYGTGFLPPAMNQLVSEPPSTFPYPYINDPERGNEPLGVITLLSGGNPDLEPEESRSWSAGLIFTPGIAPGLRLSADWIKIKKTNNIAFFGLTQLNLNDALQVPGLITRGPPSDGYPVGPITIIDARNTNVSSQTVEAVDIAGNYDWQTAAGEFSVELAATHNLHDLNRLTPGSPEVDRLGLMHVLPWQGRIELGWARNAWEAQWTTRYFDSYCLEVDCAPGFFTLSQGDTRIPHQIYHDVAVRYRVSGGAPAFLQNLDIRLGVHNVFDKKPPADLASQIGYSPWGDPRLANYYLAIRKAFE